MPSEFNDLSERRVLNPTKWIEAGARRVPGIWLKEHAAARKTVTTKMLGNDLRRQMPEALRIAHDLNDSRLWMCQSILDWHMCLFHILFISFFIQ